MVRRIHHVHKHTLPVLCRRLESARVEVLAERAAVVWHLGKELQSSINIPDSVIKSEWYDAWAEGNDSIDELMQVSSRSCTAEINGIVFSGIDFSFRRISSSDMIAFTVQLLRMCCCCLSCRKFLQVLNSYNVKWKKLKIVVLAASTLAANHLKPHNGPYGLCWQPVRWQPIT